jgi:hypothetical protein
MLKGRVEVSWNGERLHHSFTGGKQLAHLAGVLTTIAHGYQKPDDPEPDCGDPGSCWQETPEDEETQG